MIVELITQENHSQSNYIIRKQGHWISIQDKDGLSYQIVNRDEVVGITAGGNSMSLMLRGGSRTVIDISYRVEESVEDDPDEYTDRSIEHTKFEIKRITSFFFEHNGLKSALLGY